MDNPLSLPTRRALSLGRIHPLTLALGGIVLLALALRVYRIAEIPYGFHPDEGHNSVDALRILGGWRPAFLPGDNGREPLMSYLMAVSIALFGPTVFAARIVGAVAGTLVVAAQYLFVQSLPLPRPKLTALFSAGLLAVTFWPVAISHQALRSGLFPLWVTLFLWAWWQILQARSGQGHRWVAWSALTGVFVAAAIYTHMMGRLLLLVMLLSALWVAVRERQRLPLNGFLLGSATAGVLLLPMLLYFLSEPAMLTYRAGQISVLNEDVHSGDPVGKLINQAWRIALAFNIRGSLTWVDNLPGRPIFDPLISLVFFAGIGLLAWDTLGKRGQVPQHAAVLMLLTVPAMLAPTWLSEGAPSFGRMTGVWAVLFLLPAWALERGAHWVSRPTSFSHRSLSIGTALALLVIAISGVWSMYDYFARYAPEPKLYETYRSGVIGKAIHVNQLVSQGPTYVSPMLGNQATMRYLTSAAPPRIFELTTGLVLPPDGDVRYAFEPWDEEGAAAFAQHWPMAQRIDLVDRFNHRALIVFSLPRANWPLLHPVGTAAPFRPFGDHIQLEGVEVKPSTISPGKTLTVSLQWLVLAPTMLDHNLFVHLVTPQGKSVGQYDGAPLGGSYLTNYWQPGERILQQVEIPIAKDAPAGPAIIRIGWYDWRDGARLPVAGDDDAAIEVGRVEIQP